MLMRVARGYGWPFVSKLGINTPCGGSIRWSDRNIKSSDIGIRSRDESIQASDESIKSSDRYKH